MKVKVIELNHEELVDLISTGMYGCSFLGIDYNQGDWESASVKTEEPCFEDKCADILLSGGCVTIADFEGDEPYNERGMVVENRDWDCCCNDTLVEYRVSLQDILDACGTKDGIGYANALFVTENGDYYDGNNLIQIATFGEVVYG